MIREFKKSGFLLFAGCMIAATFAGCNTEKALAEDAVKGIVEAQYELAIYYRDHETPQKTKSFKWMKRAAGSRFRPAMRGLAGYYLNGYGTPVDYSLAAEWFRRYLTTTNDAAEALVNARQIMIGATKREGIIAGFTLFEIAIMQENQNGTPHSKIATEAAKEIVSHTAKIFYWLLAARNYTDAEKLLSFTEKCSREYPQTFSKEAVAELNALRKKFIIHMENI